MKLAMKENLNQGQEQLANKNKDYHTYLMLLRELRPKH
jgi:hypothetical protein